MFTYIFILVFKHTFFKSIDNMCILILIIPPVVPPIRQMYMAVEKEFRPVFLH